jgi:site-specific recombinase XerD
MELFIPSDKTQWEIIKEWIKDSDLLLLILGGRYGSIEPESGRSYTQLEYEFAISSGIPVFAIVLNDQFLANKKSKNIDLKVYEHEVENPSIEKYKVFKKKVMSNLVSLVEDINQISTEVSLILHEFLRKDDIEYQFKGWVRGNKKPSRVELSVAYNLKNFLDEKTRQGLTKGTIDNYSRDLLIFERYVKEVLVTDIDTLKIKDFLRYREDNYQINSKNSMEKVRSTLNIFFDWLVHENIILTNPVCKVKPYKFHKRGNESLNNTELEEIRNACRTQRERAILEVILSTGCRLTELGEIQLNDIDWIKKTIKISSGERDRVVFITPSAEKYLKHYLNNREDNLSCLFITERKPVSKISNRGIQREIEKISSRTNISKNISPRTFRDTYVRLMLESGYQWNTVQELLGYHSKANRSESYFKISSVNMWEVLKSRPDF